MANADVNGINVVAVPAQSDVLVTVPFNQDSEGDFTVSGVTGTGVTVAGAPFTAGEFAGTHLVRLTSGAAAGLWTTITANTTGELTLDDADVLALIAATDAFTVYPHQTVGSIMQDRLRNISFVSGTQILLFDNDAASQNKGSSATLTFITFPITTWSGAQGVDTILAPESLFVLRNSSNQALNFVTTGNVPTHPVSHLIPAGATKDILIGSGYPVDTTVGKTNFEGVAQRQILKFDNTAAGQNKGSSSTLTFITFPINGWTGGAGDQEALSPSEGFIFRQNGAPVA